MEFERHQLRPAAEADRPFARRVYEEAYKRVTERQFDEWDATLQGDRFSKAWHPEDTLMVLQDDRVIGYVQLAETDGVIAAQELVIADGVQGAESDVLRGLQRRAASRGFPLDLQVVEADWAVGLYRRLGFEEVTRDGTSLVMRWEPPDMTTATGIEWALSTVDTRLWGSEAIKSADDLRLELKRGECRLVFEDDRLVRVADGVALVLWRPPTPGRPWAFLMETLQRFETGGVRYRDLESSVGEKLVRGEDPIVAAHRCLAEELGVEVRLELDEPSFQSTMLPSTSYPGTWRRYQTCVWHLVWPESLVEAEYREEQEKKTSLWHWRRLPFGCEPPAMNARIAE